MTLVGWLRVMGGGTRGASVNTAVSCPVTSAGAAGTPPGFVVCAVVWASTITSPSAPSSLDFGVESFQFHAGVFDTKLPIDAALFAVRLVRPGRNFSLQYGQFTDAAVAETLAR